MVRLIKRFGDARLIRHELPQVLRRQPRQDRVVDLVLAEGCLNRSDFKWPITLRRDGWDRHNRKGQLCRVLARGNMSAVC
jgi:hypothetical protein